MRRQEMGFGVRSGQARCELEAIHFRLMEIYTWMEVRVHQRAVFRLSQRHLQQRFVCFSYQVP